MRRGHAWDARGRRKKYASPKRKQKRSPKQQRAQGALSTSPALGGGGIDVVGSLTPEEAIMMGNRYLDAALAMAASPAEQQEAGVVSDSGGFDTEDLAAAAQKAKAALEQPAADAAQQAPPPTEAVENVAAQVAEAKEVFNEQLEQQSLENVEATLFTKLEALSGLDDSGPQGAQLNGLFHDLYVGMAQAQHQNNVLAQRLNTMQSLVSADDDNRAQIAQHVAGLRAATDRTAAVVNDLSGALAEKADVRAVESTVSGISSLGRNLTELAQLVQAGSRSQPLAGGASMPNLGAVGSNDGGPRRRSTGVARLPGSERKRKPKKRGGGGGRREPHFSRHGGDSISQRKLDERASMQLSKQWPSINGTRSEAAS